MERTYGRVTASICDSEGSRSTDTERRTTASVSNCRQCGRHLSLSGDDVIPPAINQPSQTIDANIGRQYAPYMVTCNGNELEFTATIYIFIVMQRMIKAGYLSICLLLLLLWSPYGIGQTIIFSSCGFFLSSIFYLFFLA